MPYVLIIVDYDPLIQMTSQIDSHTIAVFQQLKVLGLSYQTVCNYLVNQNIVVSRQALRTWYLRRQKKIAGRTNTFTNGLEGNAERDFYHTTPKSAQEIDSIAMKKSPIKSLVMDNETKKSTLIQSLIQQEERRLSSLRISNAIFPVQKKSL